MSPEPEKCSNEEVMQHYEDIKKELRDFKTEFNQFRNNHFWHLYVKVKGMERTQKLLTLLVLAILGVLLGT
ncbi:MAG: hypothetical protein SVK08_00625 [Halobacteriota archaeon]|nr:hypothetical protein [Halobacteriota archaeon]